MRNWKQLKEELLQNKAVKKNMTDLPLDMRQYPS